MTLLKMKYSTMRISVIALLSLLCIFMNTDVTYARGTRVSSVSRSVVRKSMRSGGRATSKQTLSKSLGRKYSTAVSRKNIEAKALAAGTKSMPDYCKRGLGASFKSTHAASHVNMRRTTGKPAATKSALKNSGSTNSSYAAKLRVTRKSGVSSSLDSKISKGVSDFKNAKTQSQKVRAMAPIFSKLKSLPKDEQDVAISKLPPDLQKMWKSYRPSYPKEGGHFDGNWWIPNPDFVPQNSKNNPINPYNLKMSEIMKMHGVKKGIRFKRNGEIDLSPYSKMNIRIPESLLNRPDIKKQLMAGDRTKLHQELGKMAEKRSGMTHEEFVAWKNSFNGMWHETLDCGTAQLVPRELHSISHTGGVSMFKMVNAE